MIFYKVLLHPLSESVSNFIIVSSHGRSLSPDIYTLIPQVHIKLDHWETEAWKEGEGTIWIRYHRQVTKCEKQGRFERHENIRTYEPRSC